MFYAQICFFGNTIAIAITITITITIAIVIVYEQQRGLL